MIEIMKLINKYIELHGSCFSSDKVFCYFKDISKIRLQDVLLENNLIDKIDFAISLVFKDLKLLIVRSTIVLDNFNMYENIINVVEDLNPFELKYVVFICYESEICFWSIELKNLVEKICGFGGETVLVHTFDVKKNVCDDRNIVPMPLYASEEESFETLNKYLLEKPLGYHTKDSNFLFKTGFNTYMRDNHKDETLVHYLERVYKEFIYGYIILDNDFKSTTRRNKTIFNFWFKDLHLIEGCDAGVAHIQCFASGQNKKFYFVLACSNKDRTICGLNVLKYDMTIIDYEKSPTYFVIEFMHYKCEQAFFNTYFIGIFNSTNWSLFLDLFQEINNTVSDCMGSAEYALEWEDHRSIIEKYHLRFGYYLYTRTFVNAVDDLYGLGSILPWFSLPKWQLLIYGRRFKKKMLDLY